MLLRPASSSLIAVIRAHSSLAGNSFITGEAAAQTSLAVTQTLVGALCPRRQVIGIDHFANPSKILRACSLGAIRTSPLGLAIQTSEALAVVVELAGAMVGAVVLT